MANDTVVQYVLKVDAKGAQQALGKTEKEAQDVSQTFDKLEKSSHGAVQGLKKVETQSKHSTKAARNLRRAGRDLDGAFGDLAQGIGVLSPQMGHLLTEVSNGASIVEGLGRSLSLFLNPAIAVAAGVAISAGVAIAIFEAEQAKAEERAEELARVIDETNKVIEQQSKIADNASEAMIGYYQEVEQARINLQFLTGEITKFEIDQNKATATAVEFGKSAFEAQKQQKDAIEESISARTKQINLLRVEIGLQKEQRAITQPLSERIAGTPQQFEEAGFEEKGAQKRLESLQQAQKQDLKRLETVRGQNIVITGQQRSYEQILKQQALIAEQERQRARAEKARRQALKDEAELEKKFAQLEKDQEKTAQRNYKGRLSATQKAIKARQQIDGIIEATQIRSLSKVDQINESYRNQINTVKQLADASGAEATAQVAINALLEERNKKLFDIAVKEQEISKEKEKADKKAEKKKKQDDASKLVSEIAAVASLDASSIIGLINPIAGQIFGALETIGQTTPEEKRAEIKAQVDAIRLGISYLPEIFLELVPLLAVGILEAFYDGIILFGKNLVSIIKDAFNNVFNLRDRDPDGNRGGLGVGEGIKRFFDPNQQTFASGGRFIPKAQGGIRFTGMQDGLAMLHRGEFVVPQSGQRPQQVDRQLNGSGGGMTININSAVVDRNAVDALVREIEIRFNNQFGTSSSSLFGGR